ncbi:MAG: L,D-transpeptidase family protein [Chthoniobacterales bacterium]
MKLFPSLALLVVCSTVAPLANGAAGGKEAEKSSTAHDDQILRVQLFLDASAFKPGVIDGRWGEFTGQALSRYEKAHGKPGRDYGREAPSQFDLPLDESAPARIAYQITAEDQKFVGALPEKHAEQAKQDQLPYVSLLELVAEKFHAKQDFLKKINPDFSWDEAKPGDGVQVPNVSAPFDVQTAMDLKTRTEAAEKKDELKTEKDKPEGERFSLSVDVADKTMEVMQDGKLVGSYPITPGSDALPAPEGDWFVRGFSWMPTFRWDEAMLQNGERSNNSIQLPPGPNNPVGILWMELSHDGSGIHGTEEPETIGRAASHG